MIWDITQIYFVVSAAFVSIYKRAGLYKFVLIPRSNCTVRHTGVLLRSLPCVSVAPFVSVVLQPRLLLLLLTGVTSESPSKHFFKLLSTVYVSFLSPHT
jgi:hypothetical protein